MGNQATVIIRTDALSEIASNPQEFVANLLVAINRVAGGLEPQGLDFGCGYHANPARVVEVHHADSTTVVACGGSTAIQLAIVYRWLWPNDNVMRSDLASKILENMKSD